jgi:ATP/maltotriose-dependent transcriptional regulator MalT
MLGDFHRGRAECDRAADILGELGLPISALGVKVERATVELLAGDLDAAERELRVAGERFREIGDVGYLSWVDPLLARVLAERGDFTDSLSLARTARAAMQPDHAFGQIVARIAEGTALGALGRRDEATVVARDALGLAEATDAIDLRAQALLLVAELVDEDEAQPTALELRSDALALFEAKGDVVSAERVRRLL